MAETTFFQMNTYENSDNEDPEDPVLERENTSTSSVVETPDNATMIVNLKARKTSLENEILALQYDLEFGENRTARARAAEEKKLQKKQNQLQTLVKSLALHSQGIQKNSSKNLIDMQKTSLRVASTLKKFKQSTPPEVFWHQFQQGIKTYHLNDREGVMVLHSLITEHPMGSNWYANNIQENSDTITLVQVKKLFYKEFLEPNWQTARLMELMDIRFQPQETVKSFLNRFAVKRIWLGRKKPRESVFEACDVLQMPFFRTKNYWKQDP